MLYNLLALHKYNLNESITMITQTQIWPKANSITVFRLLVICMLTHMSDTCASFSLCSSIILIFALHTNIFTVNHWKQYILVQLSIIQTWYTYLLYLSRY